MRDRGNGLAWEGSRRAGTPRRVLESYAVPFFRPTSTARSKPSRSDAPAPAGDDPEVDRHQETDVWYGGYAGRTMWGSFLVCIALSLLVQAAAWYVWHDVPADQHHLLVLADETIITVIWLWQLVRWGHRKLAVGVRLTTRRLFYDQGFRYSCWSVLHLKRIARVEAKQNAVERWLRIGTIRVFEAGADAPALVITGLTYPEAAAERIRAQAEKAKSNT